MFTINNTAVIIDFKTTILVERVMMESDCSGFEEEWNERN